VHGILQQERSIAVRHGPLTLAGLALVAVALGVLVTLQPVIALAATAAALVMGWTVLRVERGVYLLVFAVPLVVGMSRGLVVPVLRPNELLLIFLLGVVVLHGAFRRAGEGLQVGPFTAIDRAFGVLFLFGSIIPLAVMLFRSEVPTSEDTFQLLSLIKFYIGYRLIIAAVPNDRVMLNVARLMLVSSIAVAAIGILQAAHLFGVHELLASYYSAGQVQESIELRRATSTLGVWQALGVYMAVHAVLAATLLSLTRPRGVWRIVLLVALVADILGAIATASLTGVVALVVGLGLAAVLGHQARRTLLIAAPALVVAAIVFAPQLAERWDYQFYSWGAGGALPVTWEYRISNLVNVFWPAVQDNLLFGVAPSISADLVWRFPENQVMFLLYQGGLLYVGAYLLFMGVVLRQTWRYQRQVQGAALAIARTAFTAWLLMLVLGLFDPHLTMAGEADAAWALLALASGAIARTQGGKAPCPSAPEPR
jgi:hypothetical protein